MSARKNRGISQTLFIIGLVATFLVSTAVSAIISAAVSTYGAPSGLRTPNYDSGWQIIAQGQALTLTHNLGTTNLYVYVVGNGDRNGITQVDYGYTVISPNRYGLAWARLTASTITVYRALQDESWDYVRVMLWVIG